jgi:hypothetical protein
VEVDSARRRSDARSLVEAIDDQHGGHADRRGDAGEILQIIEVCRRQRRQDDMRGRH